MAISSAKKLRVFKKDGFKCKKCGTSINLTIDHIVPISLGGGDGEDNLQTLCRKCNSMKSDYVPNETFFQKIFRNFFFWSDAKKLKEDIIRVAVDSDKQFKQHTINEVGQRIENMKPALKDYINGLIVANDSEIRDFKKSTSDQLVKDKYDIFARFEALEKHLKVEMVEGNYKKIKKVK